MMSQIVYRYADIADTVIQIGHVEGGRFALVGRVAGRGGGSAAWRSFSVGSHQTEPKRRRRARRT